MKISCMCIFNYNRPIPSTIHRPKELGGSDTLENILWRQQICIIFYNFYIFFGSGAWWTTWTCTVYLSGKRTLVLMFQSREVLTECTTHRWAFRLEAPQISQPLNSVVIQKKIFAWHTYEISRSVMVELQILCPLIRRLTNKIAISACW